jgi:putative Holliday junction resolvase
MNGRVMGLDYGERRIGLALSDPLGITAQPLRTLERVTLAADLEVLAALARHHEVERFVVGLPLALDGTRGERVRRTEEFAARLGRATGLPVEAWDERFTSVQAERTLLEADLSRRRRREVIDTTAAVLILQGWLDARAVKRRATPQGQGDADATGEDTP